MKTILFFDRMSLTDLYVSIGNALKDHANIVHVAYSDVEEDKLRKAGISDYICYKKLVIKYFDSTPIDFDILNEVDDVVIKYSDEVFNLNGSIQSDRGFKYLTYDEALHSAQSHYLAWRKIFSLHHVDILYHEAVSLFFNHIAAILCLKQGGEYRYMVQTKSDKEGFSYINVRGDKLTSPEIEKRYEAYINNPETIDVNRSKKFLESFRADYSVFMGSVASKSLSKTKLTIQSLKSSLKAKLYSNKYDRVRDNIDYMLLNENFSNQKLVNLEQYRRLGIKFIKNIPSGESYYYYSMHLEPESVVLYEGDGIYTNQIKLIENIAASLPVGCYLYVKDHPHELAYRKADDYYRLMQIPNVRLLSPDLPGKVLIANAIGVLSINGTAGFEGLMLNKQVYCFGKNYYSMTPRVTYIHNVRDIRTAIYGNIGRSYHDDIELYAYVNAFLDSAKSGFVNFFVDREKKLGIDIEKNGKTIAEDLIIELHEN